MSSGLCLWFAFGGPFGLGRGDFWPIFDGEAAHDGACETPFLAHEHAATPLRFLDGSIGGIGSA